MPYLVFVLGAWVWLCQAGRNLRNSTTYPSFREGETEAQILRDMAVVTHRKGGSHTCAHFFPWILIPALSRSLRVPYPLMMCSLPHLVWELEEATSCQLGTLHGEPSLWGLNT